MKPLLRAVLVINALIFLAFGVLFLLMPWTALWASMHLVTVQPPFVEQLFGVALIGLAWLAVHAAVDGALTAMVAKVSGHVEWLSGLVMMVWLLGLRTPELTGFGQVIAALAGVVMLVLGLGSVRLSGAAVRRRERAALAGAAAAARRKACGENSGGRACGARNFAAEAFVVRSRRTGESSDSELVELVVGEAIPRPAAPAPSATTFDPATGHAIDLATGDLATGRTLDPTTGRAFDPVSGHKIDPETGRPIDPGHKAVRWIRLPASLSIRFAAIRAEGCTRKSRRLRRVH